MRYCKILNISKANLAGLILGFLATLAVGAAGAAALPVSCTVLNATTVQCGATTCSGNITIDSLGAIRCAQPPVCSLAASPVTISSGASSLLTATCSPAATSYVWTGGTCAGKTASTCAVNPTVTTPYTVAGRNADGTGAAASATVTVTVTSGGSPAPTPAGPPVCNPSSGLFQGNTTLSANCSPAATSWVWKENNSNVVCSAESCLIGVLTASTTYTVTATNSFGTDIKSVAITVVPATPVCTLGADKPLIGNGETSTLTASCSPAATSYVWTGTACATNTTSSCSVTPATTGTTTYTVAGIGANGTGAAASATVTVGTPICTVSADALADAGASVKATLTASCDRTVAQYNWTPAAGLVAGTNTATVTLQKTALGTTTYTVNGQNGSGPGANTSVSVSVAKPSCSVSASPATINPGGTSTLTASCTPAASSYSWTLAAGLGTVTATNPTTLTGTGSTAVGSYPYSVTGTNAVGTGSPSANGTMTVSAVVVPPASCSVFDITWIHDLYTGGPNLTPDQTMRTGQMFAFRMPQSAVTNTLGLAYAGTVHDLYVSTGACDSTPVCELGGMNEPHFTYSTDGHAASCQLQPNTTYYINVINAGSIGGADTCPAGTPDVNCTYKLYW